MNDTTTFRSWRRSLYLEKQNTDCDKMPTKEVKAGQRKEIPLEITSDDVVLRQYTLEDAREAFALIDGNREHLSQFGDRTAAKYPTLESFEENIRNPENPDKLRFGVRNRDGVLVGTINLIPDGVNARSGVIGYYLGKEFRGKGYMTVSVRLLTEYAFNVLNYGELCGMVVLGNNASVKVLERNKYIFAGIEGNEAKYVRLKQNESSKH